MAYLDAGDIERSTLRQGDIATDMHLLGAVCYKKVTVPSGVVAALTSNQWTVGDKLETGPVIVLSHCCEIAEENGVKLTSIIVAPLRDVSRATAPEKVQELIDSNELRESGPQYSYLKYFYLPPSQALPFTQGCVADFSKIFSVRKTSYDVLLSRKVVQLTNATRQALALKIATYFYRRSEAA